MEVSLSHLGSVSPSGRQLHSSPDAARLLSQADISATQSTHNIKLTHRWIPPFQFKVSSVSLQV